MHSGSKTGVRGSNEALRIWRIWNHHKILADSPARDRFPMIQSNLTNTPNEIADEENNPIFIIRRAS
jgi:hypothetical protein